MAGNEWINGYLEAILDSGGAGGGASIEEQKHSSSHTIFLFFGIFRYAQYLEHLLSASRVLRFYLQPRK